MYFAWAAEICCTSNEVKVVLTTPASPLRRKLGAMAATLASRRSEVFWTRVFLFGASCVAGLIIARRRKLRRFHLHILNAKSADCGRLFGLDIGGTLAKMVYFQSADGAAAAQRRQMERQLNRTDPLTASERRRVEGSLPLIDDFIMSLHATDEAQREERLQMSVPELGGTIHFIKYVARDGGGGCTHGD
jgi:hypothetical protein